MGARNFGTPNIGRYFTFGFDTDPDHYDYFDEKIADDFYVFNKLGYESTKKLCGTPKVDKSHFWKDFYFTFLGVKFEVTAYITVQYGYHDGCLYDAEFIVASEFGYYEEEEYIDGVCESLLEQNWDLEQLYGQKTNGLIKMQLPNFVKRLEKEIQKELDNIIYPMLKEVCEQEINLVGTFSNGEAVYELAS